MMQPGCDLSQPDTCGNFMAQNIVFTKIFFYFNCTLKPDTMKNLILGFIVLYAISCNTQGVTQDARCLPYDIPNTLMMVKQTRN